MAGSAGGSDLPASCTAMSHDDVQQSWLGDNRDIRSLRTKSIGGCSAGPAAHQMINPQACGFFVAGHREDNVWHADRSINRQASKRGQHRGESTLHIAGATAVNSSVAFCGLVRRNRHAIDGNCVLVSVEQNGFRGPGRIDP